MSTPHSPAFNRQSQEDKLIAMAFRHTERTFDDYSVSSQVTLHFLKLGTLKAEVELEKIKLEGRLLEARIESEKHTSDSDERTEEVLEALKLYSPYGGYE